MAQTDIPKKAIKEYNGNGAGGDLNDIREDLESLKDSVLSLSKHLQRDGKAKASEVKEVINEGLDSLLNSGDKSLSALESQVKDNPRRALIMAFAAGFAINLLLRRG